MAKATNAREQIAAMNALVERGLQLPPMARFTIVADVLAAQLTLNQMLLAELEALKQKNHQP